MADLGSILYGVDDAIDAGALGNGVRIRTLVVEEWGSDLVLGGKDTTEGNSQPSLRMDSSGTFRFLWVVAEERTLSVDVKQAANASPRPRLTIKANLEMGVLADVQDSAPSGTGWVTIGPLTVEPTSAGALEVLLENLYDTGQPGTAPCYWDNITEAEP
jgi:hypothetical protein